MVYANDQWIQLPTRDLYDTQIMAMAINAARDMYEKGQQEMKDFQKLYGDFMTPIGADQDWWNQNVTGRVRDAVNALYAQGIDPLRNPQGRAMISQMINTMPYGEMARKQLRAKNAEEYYKNMAALRLNDKYNEDFSRFLGEDPSQWAPDFAGVTSPTVFKTLKDATNDWYNNRTPRDLTPEEKQRLGLDLRYNYIGYFDSDLMNVAKGQTPGWQGTPISNYYRELAKRKLQSAGVENPTADQVEAVLQRDIANAQQEWLVGPTQGKADEFAVLDAQAAKQSKLQNQKAALEHHYAMIQAGADEDGDGRLSQQELANFASRINYANSPSTPGGADLSYTTQMEINSVAQYNKEAGVNSPADYAKTTYDIAQYWANKEESARTEKDKKHAHNVRLFWERMNKEGLDKAEKNGIFERDANGDLVPSKVYARQIGLAYGAPKTGKTDIGTAREQADVYYNKFLSNASGTAYAETSADLLAGESKQKQSFPGGNASNKYRTVQLDDKEIYYTPIRRLKAAGYDVDTNSAPLIKAFNQWLKSSPRQAYIVNSSTSTASLPSTSGGRTREISGYARIPYSDFENFAKYYAQTHPEALTKGEFTEESLNQLTYKLTNDLGLPVFTIAGRFPKNGKNVWENADVVEIPITRVRKNNGSLVDSEWNRKFDEIHGGKSEAEKKAIARQAESLNKR